MCFLFAYHVLWKPGMCDIQVGFSRVSFVYKAVSPRIHHPQLTQLYHLGHQDTQKFTEIHCLYEVIYKHVNIYIYTYTHM